MSGECNTPPPRHPRPVASGYGPRSIPTPSSSISWLAGDREHWTGKDFIDDLASRIDNNPQITTDGYTAYPYLIEQAFNGKVDFAQVVKMYGQPYNAAGVSSVLGFKMKVQEGNPDLGLIGPSYVERSNLTISMGMRRYMRKTNGHSKKLEKQRAMLDGWSMGSEGSDSVRAEAVSNRPTPHKSSPLHRQGGRYISLIADLPDRAPAHLLLPGRSFPPAQGVERPLAGFRDVNDFVEAADGEHLVQGRG